MADEPDLRDADTAKDPAPSDDWHGPDLWTATEWGPRYDPVDEGFTFPKRVQHRFAAALLAMSCALALVLVFLE